MKPNDENRGEQELRLALQGLPELKAPATLIPRVLARIERGAAATRPQRSWQTWPPGLQLASFVTLLLIFTGLCFASWRIYNAPGTSLALHQAGHWLAGLEVLWNTTRTLAGAVVLAIGKLGSGVIIALMLVAACSYCACIGLGTAVARYAFARR